MTRRDDLGEVVDDAYPRCPKCLVQLLDTGDPPLVYLECPTCGDVFL